MGKEICPVCRKGVTAGMSIRHKVCRHMTHAECMNQVDPDFKQCAGCRGIAPKASMEHPRVYNGRDYVENPVVESLFTSIRSKIKKQESILTQQLPLDHLNVQHGYHLQRLLSEGVTLDDFLANGYTYDDLTIYPSIRDRKLQTLIALKCTADHFKKKQVPVDGITPRDIVESFGLYFPENCGALMSPSNEYWSAAQLVDLGFKVDDLFGAGLEYIEQYNDLEPTDAEESAMGITAADLDDLPSYTQPQPETIYVEREPEVQPEIIYVERGPQEYKRIHPRKVQTIPKIKRYHGLRRK